VGAGCHTPPVADISILDPSVAAAPKGYTVKGAQEVVLRSVTGSFDGTSAAGSWVPCVQIVDPAGFVAGTYPLASTLVAGVSADVSFFPGLTAPGLTLQVGEVRLIYDYTITGADKASINTAVDGAYAGSFPTDLNYLEVFLTGRTDHNPGAPFVVPDNVDFQFNGDTGANYNRVFVASSVGGTPNQGQTVSATFFTGVLAGSPAAANFSGLCRLFIPNYNGSTFYKICEFTAWALDNVSATSHYQIGLEAATWASTSAVQSIQTFPEAVGAKYKVGTRLTIWGR